MALDTLGSVVGKVQQRVGTLPDALMLRDIVVNKYREVIHAVDWTWRRKQWQFIFFAPINTGTVTINRGESVATFAGVTLTTAVEGRQLRVAGNNTRIITIGFIDPAHVSLDLPWGDTSVSAKAYEIYTVYQTAPPDFNSFLTVVDLQRNFQLDWWSHTAEELDRTDPRRTYGGSIAYWVVLKDYSGDGQGTVFPVIQAHGTGNVPLSSGGYTGVSDAVFTVELTAPTTFKWKKDSGSYVTGVALDGAGNAQQLQDGVSIAFPSGVSYTSGDVFSIRCSSAVAPGSPRYECWPHVKQDEIRPLMYISNLIDLSDPGAVLPRYVRGDLLLEASLADVAMWHHPDNKYYDLKLAAVHMARAQAILDDMQREDSAKESSDLVYTDWMQMPVYDSGYLASHDIGYDSAFFNSTL